jgi:hypothetical protein
MKHIALSSVTRRLVRTWQSFLSSDWEPVGDVTREMLPWSFYLVRCPAPLFLSIAWQDVPPTFPSIFMLALLIFFCNS